MTSNVSRYLVFDNNTWWGTTTLFLGALISSLPCWRVHGWGYFVSRGCRLCTSVIFSWDTTPSSLQCSTPNKEKLNAQCFIRFLKLFESATDVFASKNLSKDIGNSAICFITELKQSARSDWLIQRLLFAHGVELEKKIAASLFDCLGWLYLKIL